MSAEVEGAVGDLGTYAMDAIHLLQRRIRELEAAVEQKDRDLELALARLERAECQR